MVSIPVEPLSRDAFAPYGRVLEVPGRDADASGPGWTWWAETALLGGDGRPWGVGYLDLAPTDPAFDWAECHLRTLEAIVATSRDLLCYVGPAGAPDQARELPELDRFRAFRVPSGSGVVMDRGVWHGAPFAADGPTSALVLILEGTGRHDVTLHRFPDTPVALDAGRDPTSPQGD